MNLKRMAIGVFLILLSFSVVACGTNTKDTGKDTPSSQTQDTAEHSDPEKSNGGENDRADSPQIAEELMMKINETEVNVNWEDNDSVAALKEMCKKTPLTIQMSMYGGFEQVGSIGKSLPRMDKQMTTTAGDIVLYSGSNIVVFYGSNSWSYTKLGHITDKTASQMRELLSDGDVTITIGIKDIEDEV
ncbi:MAG: hypothetical protein IJ800_00590 [Clostridia bacterium]|nr:hypothetical protein [Clostridia bacterium]